MATRRLRGIAIRFADDGTVQTVHAQTFVDLTDGGITVEEINRPYSREYAELGAAAQSRIDDFVADVEAFINADEPLT